MAFREDAHFGKIRADQIMLGGAGKWARVDKKLRSLADPNYTYEDFKGIPTANLNTGAAAGGTTGNTNILRIGGNTFTYHIKGTQTIIIPVRTAAGLDVGLDQTADDGVEITDGVSVATAKKVFTVGTDPAFFARCKFSIEDVSGTDDCAFGFRKAEAFQAAIDNYDEMAALNVISGDIKIETILNNGDTATTDTTNDWADLATHTLEVRVSGAGVVTFLIDGKAPTVTAAFTFADGEVVIPFFYFLNHTDLAGAVTLQEWEVGYL